MRCLVGTLLFLLIAGTVSAGDLCKGSTFTKAQATRANGPSIPLAVCATFTICAAE